MMWCGNDDIMRWLHSKRLSLFLLNVAIISFSLAVICFCGENLNGIRCIFENKEN